MLLIVSPIWEESAARILKGVAHYQREHEAWDCQWDNEGHCIRDASWLLRERWDGVISRHSNALQADTCRSLGIPLVDVNNAKPLPGVPNICLDNEGVGAAGARHFVDRGFRHYAFCGFANESWSEDRRRGFERLLRESGFAPLSHTTRYPGTYADGCTPEWHQAEITGIARWLESVPRPIAIMACNDYRAVQLLDAAHLIGAHVPEDIAVLGANDDECRCELANPPLSSVGTNHFRSGFLAAQTLDRLMNGLPPAAREIHVPAFEVATRQSTDVLAVGDKKLAAAVRFIQENACTGITVDQVCRHAGIARTQLEERFRKFFVRTPQSEIRRVQLARIKQLLQDTDLPLRVIAELAGFTHTESMIVFFKRVCGEPPGAFRKRLRFRQSATRTASQPLETA